MVEITAGQIDAMQVLRSVESPLAGAVVMVLGKTREVTGDRQTLWLDYECYEPMARAQLASLEADARRRWPITGCAIVHRVGRVEVGEASVAVAVSSPHRGESFEAAEWLLDTLKQVVAIWKREHWADGTSQWVHPGVTPAAEECKHVANDRPNDC
ncbi:MAG TPA: molybdenum cofactor biosynthesis protein MoaE [Pirellulales bacterium]|jgi:molybdopterin synthase catalytic subunit|nr:molybdenum cofactor biosynthesis protein MoaE [Pirellulales bacterium]